MNPYLHNYPSGNIVSPTSTTVYQELGGKNTHYGYFISYLPASQDCSANPAFQFSPSLNIICYWSDIRGASPFAPALHGAEFIHVQGSNYSYADGHVKYMRVGGSNVVAEPSNNSMYKSLDANGKTNGTGCGGTFNVQGCGGVNGFWPYPLGPAKKH
ncbi:MAG: hypothetical protein H8F28_14800 [Fibrella sp.]|nr:hypothetical protein [Armatimonadota bacterium]